MLDCGGGVGAELGSVAIGGGTIAGAATAVTGNATDATNAFINILLVGVDTHPPTVGDASARSAPTI
jgi:hypothetical protein